MSHWRNLLSERVAANESGFLRPTSSNRDSRGKGLFLLVLSEENGIASFAWERDLMHTVCDVDENLERPLGHEPFQP